MFLPALVVVVVKAMATKNNKPDMAGARRVSVAVGMETCSVWSSWVKHLDVP